MKLNAYLALFTNLVKEEYFVQTACMKERRYIIHPVVVSIVVLQYCFTCRLKATYRARLWTGGKPLRTLPAVAWWCPALLSESSS